MNDSSLTLGSLKITGWPASLAIIAIMSGLPFIAGVIVGIAVR